MNEIRLRENGEITEATVTDTRIKYVEDGVFYQVKYQFHPTANTLLTYTHTELFIQRNIWASIKKYKWDEVTQTKRLNILYLPDNPTLNRPVDTDHNTLGRAIFGICVSLFAIGPLLRELLNPKEST